MWTREEAIRVWEGVLGRPVPDFTVISNTGKVCMNPEFAEWMMGLPKGWVSDPALDLTRAKRIDLMGNGVVPQQIAEAIRFVLTDARSSSV